MPIGGVGPSDRRDAEQQIPTFRVGEWTGREGQQIHVYLNHASVKGPTGRLPARLWPE